MASEHERFFEHRRYAVVGHTSERPFPRLTYRGLKQAGKEVFAVDPSAPTVEGDRAWADLASLPGRLDGALLELPRAETAAWVERAADAGIPRVWIHQNSESPEALEVAERRGLEVHTGGCAVMYLARGLNAHTLHKGVWKILGRY